MQRIPTFVSSIVLNVACLHPGGFFKWTLRAPLNAFSGSPVPFSGSPVLSGGLWWSLVVSSALWWSLVVSSALQWLSGGLWWSLVVSGGLQCPSVALWWSLVVFGGLYGPPETLKKTKKGRRSSPREPIRLAGGASALPSFHQNHSMHTNRVTYFTLRAQGVPAVKAFTASRFPEPSPLTAHLMAFTAPWVSSKLPA